MAQTNLAKILDIANAAYGDDSLYQGYDHETGQKTAEVNYLGDTLASFIVIEIVETYDDTATWEEQVAEAYRVINNAREELADVLDALARED